MYGYALCETTLGLLVGVSNLFTSGYSGLYLLNEEKQLINIGIGEPIPNVQFIVNHSGEIYLYGNDYSHLYSFNLFSLEDDNGSLSTTAVVKIPFDNNFFLYQFELGEDGKTAVLRDTSNRVYFYQNTDGDGFKQVSLDPVKFDPAVRYLQVIRGNYRDGDYNAYLLIPAGINGGVVVMEHKSTHRLLVNTLDYEKLSFNTCQPLCGAGFRDDNFVFLFKPDEEHFLVQKGQVLFDEIYQAGAPEVYTVYESTDLHFKRKYVIEGEIKSLYNFTDIKVKSLNPAVTFDNGRTEIIVPVDKINRFMVNRNIAMQDAGEGGLYDLLFIPTKPVFQWMRTGLRITAAKDFRNTCLIPEFDLMDNWSVDELKMGKKLLKIKIRDNRYIPSDSQIRLIVNFTTEISGFLSEIEPGKGVYKVKHKTSRQDLNLEGVKPGCNRVQWWISYGNGLISTSTSGKAGMNDYLLTLPAEVETVKTTIDFPIRLQTYYNNTPGSPDRLPDFKLLKDKASTVIIYLNKEVLWQDSGEKESFLIDAWETIALREGRNYLEVYNSEDVKEPETFEYIFLYDTVSPKIAIDSCRFDSGYRCLLELTTLVTETNLDRVELYWEDDSAAGKSRIDAPVEVTYIGGDMYRVHWYNLHGNEIIPTARYKVEVKARDHSGKYNELQVVFTGLKDVSRPEPPFGEKVDISGFIYSRDSLHPYFDKDDGKDPYHGHIKFYNAAIALQNQSVPDSLTEERYTDILIGNRNETAYNGELILKTGDSIGFKKGFALQRGAALDSGIVAPGVKANYKPPLFIFPHRQAAEGVTFLFQFRDDYEPYYKPGSCYRRVFTLYDNPAEEISLYLAIKDGDNRFYLVREARDFNNELTGTDLLESNNIQITYNRGTAENWNTVNLAVQKKESKICLSVNDNEPVSVSIPDMDIYFDEMLAQDHKYYFGTTEAARQAGKDTGHFSIARIFYLNDAVEASTAQDVLSYFESGTSVEEEPYRTYNFLDDTDDVGSKYYQLRTENDHFSPFENANYSEDNTRGSLKVCSEQKNVLHYEKGSGVCYADTEKPLLINLDADYSLNGGESMELQPKSSLFPGKYFFGNQFGNHGLYSNQWYSISGHVRAVGDKNGSEGEADSIKLVMRIDNREQSLLLKEGDFHFVYQHDVTLPLHDVVLYLETDKRAVIDKNIIFNEGNYKLPPEGINGLRRSRATTKYIFFPKGTVDFWYKPFNVNNGGYVSYNSVLFDGGYVKIGAGIKSGEKFAKYYVELNHNTRFFEQSDVLVREGWQHLQFTYSRDDDVAYFYVDGKMAVKYEGGPDDDLLLPEPPGVVPDMDNVFLGSDSTGRFFAQGYLDEVQFSNLYYGPRYDNKVYDSSSEQGGRFYNKYNPLSIEYRDEPGPVLDIKLNDPSFAVSALEYCLDAKDRFFRQITKPAVVGEHGFDLEQLTPGAYLLNVKMVINGHRFRTTYYFVKNCRPMFKINTYTPIVITGVNTDIVFNLEYDGSYLLNSKESVFAAFALRLKGSFVNNYNLVEEFVKTCYLAQDFIHQDKNNKKWFVNDEEGILRGNPWQELELKGKTLEIVFKNITANADILWDMRSFYIAEQFDPARHLFAVLAPEKTGLITNAYFTAEIQKVKYGTGNLGGAGSDEAKEYEYRIAVQLGSAGRGSGGILEEMGIHYQVKHKDTGEVKSGMAALKGASTAALYYDDILPDNKYGKYECVLALMYKGEAFGSKPPMTLNREKVLNVLTPEEEKFLEISDFSLLYLDKKSDQAKLYLEYNQNNVSRINYDLTVISTETGKTSYSINAGLLNPQKTFMIFSGIDVSEGACYIKIKVYADTDGLVPTADLQVVNSAVAPGVILTNSVDSLISYNNVMFSWKGYHEGIYKSDIEYSCNFDEQGWTAPASEWKKI